MHSHLVFAGRAGHPWSQTKRKVFSLQRHTPPTTPGSTYPSTPPATKKQLSFPSPLSSLSSTLNYQSVIPPTSLTVVTNCRNTSPPVASSFWERQDETETGSKKWTNTRPEKPFIENETKKSKLCYFILLKWRRQETGLPVSGSDFFLFNSN